MNHLFSKKGGFEAVFATFFFALIIVFSGVPTAVHSQELLQNEPQKDVNEGEAGGLPITSDDGSISHFNQLTLKYEGSDVPVILPRVIWENDPSLTGLLTWLPEIDHQPPDYHAISRIVVHDLGCPPTSTTCNSDTIDPRKIIQSMYRFHAVTRGWGDIGYNYIIDRQGRIYEGRYGGNAVRGAHLYHDSKCDNFNVGSVGIVLLGRYDTSPMPQVMQEGLARLTAWIASTNGLDLQNSITSEVWHNPRTNGSCDVATGGFSSSFTGPVLSSHGDIESGNSDKFSLASINTQAIAFQQSIIKYVYSAATETETFDIKNGFRKKFVIARLATDTSSVATSSDATSTPSTNSGQAPPAAPSEKLRLSINKNQLLSFPPGEFTTYADGDLLKSDTRNRVYVVDQGKRRLIASDAIFNKYGFDWRRLKTSSDRELAYTPLGKPLGFPEGSLLAKGNGDVYLVKNEEVRHVTSAALFNSLNLIWKGITPVTTEEFKSHRVGEPLIFADGALIRGPEPRVYLVESKKRRPVGSAELFNTLKLDWKGIKRLERFELDRYPLSKFVSWPSGTLLRAEAMPKVYLIENGSKRWITTAEEFQTRAYVWSDITTVSKTELADYPDGETIGVVVPEEPLPVPEATSTPSTDTSPSTTTPSSTTESTSTPSTNSGQAPPQEQILAPGPLIRIGIYSFAVPHSFGIRANKPYGVYTTTGLQVSHAANEATSLVVNSTNEFYRFASVDPNVIFEILSYNDKPSWDTSGTLNDNKFRGSIEVKYSSISKKLWVVNELALEDYIKGVSEAGNNDQAEHLKVFSVASRSYATYHLDRGGKRTGEVFHLNNTPSDQVYKGYGFELRAPNWIEAVKATNGEIAMYNGTVIVAAYSSGAPGPTLSACTLWGGKFCEATYDYLDGGVNDPEGTTYTYAGCTGANHCVGIDAAGARRLAELGKAYREILAYYYLGIAIQDQY